MDVDCLKVVGVSSSLHGLCATLIILSKNTTPATGPLRYKPRSIKLNSDSTRVSFGFESIIRVYDS